MTLPLPDPYVGGPQADEIKDLTDPRQLQLLIERLDGIQRNFTKLAQQFPVAAENLSLPETAIAFPFALNWAAVNTTTYYKSASRVYLAGYVNKTNGAVPAVGDVIGNLPSGYRPPVNTLHAVPSGAAANVFGVVRITPAGVVDWIAGSPIINDSIGFDGINFRVA